MSEESYLRVLKDLHLMAKCGDVHQNRTGVETASMFGNMSLSFNVDRSFPLLTTKKVHFKSVVEELLWFLRGETNVRSLQAKGVSIWDEWADSTGDLGPVYGKQWRDFGGVDQISTVIDQIRTTPDSRRLIVSAWNPPEVKDMALPPCHMMFQLRVDPYSGQLCMQMYQRSADWFLGVPFNIASYALLLTILAHESGLVPGTLSMVFGDVHLYVNHLDAAFEQFNRPVRPPPSLIFSPGNKRFWELEAEDFALVGYDPHPSIKAPVAV